jgi:hypothetical protein
MVLVKTSLQPCFGERLGLPSRTRGLVTKGPSQQLTTRILGDDINKLNAASQPLIRSFVIRDMLL